MPRGTYNRQKKDAVVKTQPVLVPDAVYTELNWWDKLDEREQKTIKNEGEQLAVALLNHGRSRLAIGEHLANIQTVLEPKKLFVKFLKNFHFSVKTAYRYMNGFKNAQRELPASILQAAMARGYNMIGESEQKPLGIYTSAARQLPPPANPTPEQTNAWLDSVEQVRKKTRSTPVTNFAPEQTAVLQDPDTLLKECFRFVENRFRKLPDNARVKTQFIKSLAGYSFNLAGLKAERVAPMAPPADYKAERGRPRTVNVPEEQAA